MEIGRVIGAFALAALVLQLVVYLQEQSDRHRRSRMEALRIINRVRAVTKHHERTSRMEVDRIIERMKAC